MSILSAPSKKPNRRILAEVKYDELVKSRCCHPEPVEG